MGCGPSKVEEAPKAARGRSRKGGRPSSTSPKGSPRGSPRAGRGRSQSPVDRGRGRSRSPAADRGRSRSRSRSPVDGQSKSRSRSRSRSRGRDFEPWHYSSQCCGFPPLKPVPPRKYKLKQRVSRHGIPYGKRTPTRLTIFVLGGPGCGKGTQCEEIVKNYGFVHLSAGELLREEIKNKTQIGLNCEELMAEGKLVPSEIPLNLLKTAMENSEHKHFLIDGFPRSVDQAQLFEKKICKPNLVIYLECPFKVMQERLVKRGETSGRSDDNMDTIKKRFETYRKESFPVVRYYEKFPNMLKTVSSAMSPTDVFAYIAELLHEHYGLVAKFAPVITGFDHRQHNCKKRTIIFVLGGPGCGKGTQCERMVRDFGYSHLSTGDLLRAEVASGSDLGKQCDGLMKEGKLVPLAVTINLLKQAMNKAKCKRFLIDGFPRAVEQAHEFEAKVGKPDVVLCLDCSLELMQKRLLERGKASGRADDNIDTIKKRFETFLAESKPVIDYYKKTLPKAVKSIPTDKLPDAVYEDVKAALKATVEKRQPKPR